MALNQHIPSVPQAHGGLNFAAIDFETANQSRGSACAVGIVRVEGGKVVDKKHWLIRPPSSDFMFTYIHGITWAHVRTAPPFAEVWGEVTPVIAGVDFLAAHNAPFDQSVLAACGAAAGLPPVDIPFQCTVRLARTYFDIRPTKLPDVCHRLGISLKHHDALSDAEACAQIVIASAEVRAARGG